MNQHIVDVLSIPFINTTKDQLVKDMNQRISRNEKTFVVTANPEIVEYANAHQEYKDILMNADYIVPDGIGIIMASKLMKQPLVERITGFDLLHDLLKLADQHAYRVYFLGAEQNVIEKAAGILQRDYPNMTLAGYHHGYISVDDAELAASIAAVKPDIIITALGFPRQEEWVTLHNPLFEKGLFMGVGGSFDVIAGKVNRAPAIWQKLNLEWMYRLIQQPSRWKRMLVLPKFALKVLSKRK